MIRGIGNESYQKKLKELGLFALAKQRVRQNISVLSKHIREINTKARKEPFKLNDNIGARTIWP